MATANFGKIQIGIYVEIKRSDGEPRRRPCRPARLSALCGGDAGAGRLIDCSAGLWGREGGGRGAFVCGVCASEASLGSAPGAAAVPNRGGALRGAGPGGGRRGRARGSPVVFGWVRRRVPGRGAPRSSPGTPARGRQAPIGLTQPRGSPRPFHFPASSLSKNLRADGYPPDLGWPQPAALEAGFQFPNQRLKSDCGSAPGVRRQLEADLRLMWAQLEWLNGRQPHWALGGMGNVQRLG